MQYIIRHLSTKWKTSQMYLPQIKAEECSLYEVIFTKLKNQDKINVCLPIPDAMNKKKIIVYFSEYGKMLIQIKAAIIDENIQFITNKMGVFVVMETPDKQPRTSDYLAKIINLQNKFIIHSKNRFDFGKMK